MNMPTETFVAFLAMTTFMSFVPGPSVLFVATQGAWRGRAAGLSAVAGVQLGVLTYFLLTAFGLTRIIAASGTAFMIVKWVGAAYLLWLGVTAIVGTLRRQAQPPPQLRPSAYGFRDGLVVALSNPKAILYFLAFLPQFIDPSRPMIAQVAMLGVVAMSIDIIAQSTYALAGAAVSSSLTKPDVRRWFERGVGAMFVSLAAVTALYRRVA